MTDLWTYILINEILGMHFSSLTCLIEVSNNEVRVRGIEGEKERSDALKVLVKHSLKSGFTWMAQQPEVQLGLEGFVNMSLRTTKWMRESWKTIAKPQWYFHKRLLDLLTVPVLRLVFSRNIGFTWPWILVQLLAGLQADQGLDSPPPPFPTSRWC